MIWLMGKENNMDSFADIMDAGMSVTAIAEALVENIMDLPVNGIFKIRIKNKVSDEDKVRTEFMVNQLAVHLGRPDVTIIIEGEGDLN